MIYLNNNNFLTINVFIINILVSSINIIIFNTVIIIFIIFIIKIIVIVVNYSTNSFDFEFIFLMVLFCITTIFLLQKSILCDLKSPSN